MYYNEGARVFDERYNRQGRIDSIESKPKGVLFRIQFENGKWGSYYETTVHKRFSLLPSQKETPKQAPKLDDANVVFLNLRNRSRFLDRCQWLSWLKTR